MSRYDYCEILCGGVGQERARIENSEHGTSDSWECAKVSIHTRNCTTIANTRYLLICPSLWIAVYFDQHRPWSSGVIGR